MSDYEHPLGSTHCIVLRTLLGILFVVNFIYFWMNRTILGCNSSSIGLPWFVGYVCAMISQITGALFCLYPNLKGLKRTRNLSVIFYIVLVVRALTEVVGDTREHDRLWVLLLPIKASYFLILVILYVLIKAWQLDDMIQASSSHDEDLLRGSSIDSYPKDDRQRSGVLIQVPYYPSEASTVSSADNRAATIGQSAPGLCNIYPNWQQATWQQNPGYEQEDHQRQPPPPYSVL